MAIQKGPGRVFHACHLPPLSELPTSLEKGETDLAIGMININGQGIRSVTLFEEEYVAIVGSGHLCLPKTIDDLKQARLVVSAPAATYGKDLNDNLARAGLIDNIVLRLSHFGALPMLLHEIDLVAIVPRQLAVELQSGEMRQYCQYRSNKGSPASI